MSSLVNGLHLMIAGVPTDPKMLLLNNSVVLAKFIRATMFPTGI